MDIKVLITGDYCPIGRNIASIENNDFSFIEAFAPHVANSDFSITNLEAPITDSVKTISKSGPPIKAGKKSLLPLKKIGFDLVTLANNHILDYTQAGVKSTIEQCKANNIAYVGAGENLKEARKLFKTTIKEKNIGILNFAENEFCAATQTTYGANPVNLINNHYDITNAKKEVDYLIVIAHGGREHYQLPTPATRERYRFYANSGADAIIGHHTHCCGGYEVINDVPIFYSLGNFIFDYKEKYQKGIWTEGYAVELILNEKKIDFKLIPFYQGRKENKNLVLFNKQEKNKFDKKISEINSIILDDKLFFESWKNYIASQMKAYKGLMYIKNDYIRAAMTRGLIPKLYFVPHKFKVLLLNLFRCEVHNEIMKEVLIREINE